MKDKMDKVTKSVIDDIYYRDLIEQLPFIIKNLTVTAKLYKATYDALRKEGFGDLQAMGLLKARGWMLDRYEGEQDENRS